jgi:hypothetical protein
MNGDKSFTDDLDWPSLVLDPAASRKENKYLSEERFLGFADIGYTDCELNRRALVCASFVAASSHPFVPVLRFAFSFRA